MRPRDRGRGPPPNECAALESGKAENPIRGGARTNGAPARRIAPPRPPPPQPKARRSAGTERSHLENNNHSSNTQRYSRPKRSRQARPSAAALRAAARFLAPSPRGRRVFPMAFNRDPDAKKYPLTTHGMNDATRDAIQLKEWWAWRANAVPAIVTGEASGIVALDIDIRPDGSGFDSLDELGITTHPIAPTAHTPRGGCAVLFK